MSINKMLYNKIIPAVKKNAPKFYTLLKNIKHRYVYNQRYFNQLISKNLYLIDHILEKKHEDWAKDVYFQKKNSVNDVGVIEINNSCNINCVMCDTRSSVRQKKLMSLDLVEKSVLEFKKKKINSVLLHTIGDPLVNTKLGKILQILRNYKMQTAISTNGLLLEKHLDTLKEYVDVCSSIRFSIDGVKKETYEKIRFGGKWEDLIRNLDLAKKWLPDLGYEFMIDLVITKDNFDELGEFVTFFRDYVKKPYRHLHLNFMNSLSPNNDYFLKNNTIPKHTHINSFCKYVSQTTPYILVDGRMSVCCRDYDGSLVIGSINEDNGIDDVMAGEELKQLQQAHESGDLSKTNNNLCKSCYIIDGRVQTIWTNSVAYLLYKHDNESSGFYQKKFNNLLDFFNKLSKDNYKQFLSQIC